MSRTKQVKFGGASRIMAWLLIALLFTVSGARAASVDKELATKFAENWLKAAGITKKISFHCSRHTFGSLQVDAGTSVYTVQHMLGHKNVSTTQIYANMADESKRESVNRITLKPKITPQLKVVGQ